MQLWDVPGSPAIHVCVLKLPKLGGMYVRAGGSLRVLGIGPGSLRSGVRRSTAKLAAPAAQAPNSREKVIFTWAWVCESLATLRLNLKTTVLRLDSVPSSRMSGNVWP